MIACLTGKLLFSDPLAMTCVIDCAGVGYSLSVTSATIGALPPADENGGAQVRLYTHLQVREDGVELFGFLSQDELRCFKLLITVSGVGPKAAMAILSLYSPDALAALIAEEDVKSISKAQGVGSKTAGRIVLELGDKMAKFFPTAASFSAEAKRTPARGGGKALPNSSAVSDARDALIVLGYSQADVNSALAACDTSLPADELIRNALAILSER